MKNSLETRLGFFFALVIIAAFILLEMIGAGALFSHGTELHARFNAVRDLKVGDAVRLAGVPVGRVKKISIQQSSCRSRCAAQRDQGESPHHPDQHGPTPGIAHTTCSTAIQKRL